MSSTTNILRYGWLIMCLGLAFLGGCTVPQEQPDPASEQYEQAISDFYVALSAMQADRALFAVEKMEAFSRQYPREAAGWANLAVFSMRQGNFQAAEQHLGKALEQDPENAQLFFLKGILESRRGNVDEAIAALRQAAETDSSNIKVAYALAQELERQNPEANAAEVRSLLSSILNRDPDNLAVLLEVIRLTSRSDGTELRNRALDQLARASRSWPQQPQSQFRQVRTSMQQDGQNLTFELALLRNSMNQLPAYQADLAAVQLPPNQVGFLVTRFSWLPQPETSTAPADTSLTFETSDTPDRETWSLIKAVALNDQPSADLIRLREGEAEINHGTVLGYPGRVTSRYGIATIDYNYDFRNDLAFAGSAGFRLYRQEQDSTFADVTDSLGLPAGVQTAPYHGLWSWDIDLDGDLDLVLAPASGTPRLLRNNGDGSFSTARPFEPATDPVAFLWADFDGDADPDGVFLEKNGQLKVLLNARSGAFTVADALPSMQSIIDIAVSDINNDGVFDLLVWTREGISRLYFEQEQGRWQQAVLAEGRHGFENLEAGEGTLYAADLDNNGGSDLIATSPRRSRYWLNTDSLHISAASRPLPPGIQDIADLDGDMRLDLLHTTPEGLLAQAMGRGNSDYHARVIRPRASGPLGDQRINSFGIGGAIETRSGLLYQKQLISRPWVHLGLGRFEEAEMLRIIWPNGTSQTEFAELGYGSQIFNEQILKGSCPWLFAYNGEEMAFVTDFIWRSPLGLRINAQATAGVVQTEDRVLIRGQQLEQKDGYYELRITADLWETHFFDHISLMAVDHPRDTDVFIDERFAIPAPSLAVRPTAPPQPVKKVLDQQGRDVSDRVRAVDGQYLDVINHTKYQGLAEEHYVEIVLGEELPAGQPLWLLANGWVRPTDSSINYALSQGSLAAPEGLSVEVPDGNGGWEEVQSELGFPAGKAKTVMIDLQDVVGKSEDNRLRLRTTTEIYWDAIRWAESRPGAELQKQLLNAGQMELRYRGFSEVYTPNSASPDLPRYQTIAGTTPKWYDLEGYYTRFGDVSELLQGVDDRYVIMNAGDELVLRFKVPDAPRPGWTRDFVLIGDGWVKDGDYNTKFSRTVRPLPSHYFDAYAREKLPPSLADDPVFRKHAEDWIQYHTRYITPRGFQTAVSLHRDGEATN